MKESRGRGVKKGKEKEGKEREKHQAAPEERNNRREREANPGESVLAQGAVRPGSQHALLSSAYKASRVPAYIRKAGLKADWSRCACAAPRPLQPRPLTAYQEACASAWLRPCPSSPAPSGYALKPRGRPVSRLPKQRPAHFLLCSSRPLRLLDVTQPQRMWGGVKGGAGAEAEARVPGAGL